MKYKRDLIKDMLLIIAIITMIIVAIGFFVVRDLQQDYLCRKEGYHKGFIDLFNESYCLYKLPNGDYIKVRYKGIMHEKGQ